MDLLNGLVKAIVEIDKAIGGPESLLKLFPGNHLARSLQQQGQDFPQLDLQSALSKLSPSEGQLRTPLKRAN